MFLQRTLQNGREALLGAYRLGPPQVGHLTVGPSALSGIGAGAVLLMAAKSVTGAGLCAQRQLKSRILCGGLQLGLTIGAHQTH